MITAKAVLRYPGGKQRAIKILASYIPSNQKEICSPFVGGGGFELHRATACGIQVFAYDNFTPLVEFWQTLLRSPKQLAEKVSELMPLSREHFYRLQNNQPQLPTKLERAAAFYAINRASFSGCTLIGGMSPGHPRFTHSSVERLRNFPSAVVKKKFSVTKMDFTNSIMRHPDALVYADPPYMLKNQNLYGSRNNRQSFDHQQLHDVLMERGGRWLLSYNDCEQVRQLYNKGCIILTPQQWRYGMSRDKNSRELLILSKELANVLDTQSGMASAG